MVSQTPKPCKVEATTVTIRVRFEEVFTLYLQEGTARSSIGNYRIIFVLKPQTLNLRPQGPCIRPGMDVDGSTESLCLAAPGPEVCTALKPRAFGS